MGELPRTVRARGPFDAARLLRSVARAGRTAGLDHRAADELAAGALHFLRDFDDEPTCNDIAERVETAVRELGQPGAALAYRQGRAPALPSEVADRLAGVVLDAPPTVAEIASVLTEASAVASRFVAFDRVESRLASAGTDPADWWNALHAALPSTGLLAFVNVGTPEPTSSGPLFPTTDASLTMADHWLDALEQRSSEKVRLVWHAPVTERLVDMIEAGRPITVAFASSRRPPLLADGVRRGLAGALAVVRVQFDDGADATELGRSVAAWGAAQRARLRQSNDPHLLREFRLDRTVLDVELHGVDAFARQQLGRLQGPDGAAWLRTILRAFAGSLAQAAGPALPVAITLPEPLLIELTPRQQLAAWNDWGADLGGIVARWPETLPVLPYLTEAGRLAHLDGVQFTPTGSMARAEIFHHFGGAHLADQRPKR